MRRVVLLPLAAGLALVGVLAGPTEARAAEPEVRAWRYDPQEDRSVWTVAVAPGRDATRVYVAGRLASRVGSLWIRREVRTTERHRRWVHVRVVRPGRDYHQWTRTYRVVVSSTQS